MCLSKIRHRPFCLKFRSNHFSLPLQSRKEEQEGGIVKPGVIGAAKLTLFFSMRTLLVGLLVILQYLTHHSAEAFNIMTDLKIPNIAEAAKAQQAKDRFGEKKIAVVTGTSSGLGRKTALALLRTGQYHVVGAVRDLDKMEAVAEIDEFDPDSFTAMHCELNSFESVRQFCHDLEKVRCHRPIDRLICNAGVYQPSLPHAKWSMDGIEQTMQINYLSHFLMIRCVPSQAARVAEAAKHRTFNMLLVFLLTSQYVPLHAKIIISKCTNAHTNTFKSACS